MIDPKILQRHFRTVHEREQPPVIQDIKTTEPDPVSLTAIPFVFQEENIETKEPLTEIEPVELEEEAAEKTDLKAPIESYDPYGYYSSLKN